jgi:hypothetical protein
VLEMFNMGCPDYVPHAKIGSEKKHANKHDDFRNQTTTASL